MLPTHTWNAAEILLEARYFKTRAESKTITAFYPLSIARIPASFARDRISLVERPALLVKGLDLKDLGPADWDRLCFTDLTTGEEKDFTVRFMDTFAPDSARFAILREP